jgi:hypothetical protein
MRALPTDAFPSGPRDEPSEATMKKKDRRRSKRDNKVIDIATRAPILKRSLRRSS